MKICRFRRCKKEITTGQSNKEFCNGSCRRMEQTYRKREKMKNEKTNTK